MLILPSDQYLINAPINGYSGEEIWCILINIIYTIENDYRPKWIDRNVIDFEKYNLICKIGSPLANDKCD